MLNRTVRHMIVLGIALILGSFAASLLSSRATAAPPDIRQSISLPARVVQRETVQETITLTTALPMVYDLYLAEPAELRYVLEFRYLETSFQEGGEWTVFSTADDPEKLQGSILWIAFHLVAEWRVVQRWSEPEFRLYDTYDSLSDAEADASFFEELGLLTEIDARVDMTQMNQLLSRP